MGKIKFFEGEKKLTLSYSHSKLEVKQEGSAKALNG